MSGGNYRKEHNCLNCGDHIEKRYCSNCGQANLELKEPFWHFVSHSIGHYFHFDSKFFQTLVPLLTKPGQVTLDYIAGKRARYLPPVSMYIFVSIVYFLVVPHAKNQTQTKSQKKTDQQVAQETRKLQQQMQQVKDSVNIPGLPAGALVDIGMNRVYEQLDRKKFRKLSFRQQAEVIRDLEAKNKATGSDSLARIIRAYKRDHITKEDSTYQSYLARQSRLPESERDDWLERFQTKKDIKIRAKTGPEWTIEKELDKYRPKQYFLLMPLLAFFIMLNFRKNHIYYLDHLIFTIHGMIVFFIVQIIAVPVQHYIFGAGSTVSQIIGLLVFAGMVWYLYEGLRKFYNRSRGQTIKKVITVMLLYNASLIITEALIAAILEYTVT
ncbi:hypothetical protein C7T94_09890 [Pedobacter yulinensis]|uniref:DUF3667 domain-containing protein n=1 Tax=Pedobacter yulinensis TaxID=2126353 RepID=A0A2T3HKJ9_9SPHI|nr:DUF3667 domain-containing protein [Pedobacter yulinensis]PST82933.1 hypothetical protein C7T94_09890 [Pedobacter yulinensis]